MQRARMIGNYIQKLADEQGLSISDLSSTIHCRDYQVAALLKGRALASFSQISDLASRLNVSVDDILNCNKCNAEHYNKTVVHCMNQFQNNENREKILDIIDDYMDLLNAVGQ